MTVNFDEDWYLRQYPDVADAISRGKVPSALAHYERHGRSEGRQPSPLPRGADSVEVPKKSYQTFPDGIGDSNSPQKLRSLKLPDFQGKSVLDVGCNEGYFSFEAVAGGASRVLGIDRNSEIIVRAKDRKVRQGIADQLDFVCQGWDTLPNEKFDIIIFLSALHYADDQLALIRRLVDHLSPNGVLILECGIVSEETNDFVEIQRAIDVVHFPTMGRIKDWLAPYAWKLIGDSVDQIGDPIPRKVFHIQVFRKEVMLLMGAGYTGKTTFARTLSKFGVPNIMIDDHVRLYYDRGPYDTKLGRIIKKNYNGARLDYLYREIIAEGALDELVDDIVNSLDQLDSSFSVVEGALGSEARITERVAKRIEARGYFVWLCNRA